MTVTVSSLQLLVVVAVVVTTRLTVTVVGDTGVTGPMGLVFGQVPVTVSVSWQVVVETEVMVLAPLQVPCWVMTEVTVDPAPGAVLVTVVAH